jgi:hypothetical protein
MDSVKKKLNAFVSSCQKNLNVGTKLFFQCFGHNPIPIMNLQFANQIGVFSNTTSWGSRDSASVKLLSFVGGLSEKKIAENPDSSQKCFSFFCYHNLNSWENVEHKAYCSNTRTRSFGVHMKLPSRL